MNVEQQYETFLDKDVFGNRIAILGDKQFLLNEKNERITPACDGIGSLSGCRRILTVGGKLFAVNEKGVKVTKDYASFNEMLEDGQVGV